MLWIYSRLPKKPAALSTISLKPAGFKLRRAANMNQPDATFQAIILLSGSLNNGKFNQVPSQTSASGVTIQRAVRMEVSIHASHLRLDVPSAAVEASLILK